MELKDATLFTFMDAQDLVWAVVEHEVAYDVFDNDEALNHFADEDEGVIIAGVGVENLIDVRKLAAEEGYEIIDIVEWELYRLEET